VIVFFPATNHKSRSQDAQPRRMAVPADATQRFGPYDHTTPEFSLEGLEAWCRLVDVHDGDTLTVVAEFLPGHFGKFHLRLLGIDTAEMTADAPAVKAKALAARDRVMQLCTGCTDCRSPADIRAALTKQVVMVRVRCGRNDKYGRTLADVSDSQSGGSIAARLLAEGLAKPYDGGTKPVWP
jgi:endonuclease YncB( thermonuclease family)